MAGAREGTARAKLYRLVDVRSARSGASKDAFPAITIWLMQRGVRVARRGGIEQGEREREGSLQLRMAHRSEGT